MPTTNSIVLATGNQGKVKELQALLGDTFILKAQTELQVESPIEDGLTFVENALIKARHASKVTGLPAIADDSGLSVDALDGAPGIYSARYAGEDASDADNNAKLLAAIEPHRNRSAHFHCALVYLQHWQDPTPIICEGVWHGHILTEAKGSNGFGYDPLFFATDQQCASAELTSAIKNAVSHRGKAVAQLISLLAHRE